MRTSKPAAYSLAILDATAPLHIVRSATRDDHSLPTHIRRPSAQVTPSEPTLEALRANDLPGGDPGTAALHVHAAAQWAGV